MEATGQAIHDLGGIPIGYAGELGIAGGGGDVRVAEERLDVADAQAVFEEVGCEGMAQAVDGRFFLMPALASIFFIAAWVPPRSMGVVAARMVSIDPAALGNSRRG